MTAIVTLTFNPAIDVSTSVERMMPFHKLRCAEAQRDPGGGDWLKACRNLVDSGRAEVIALTLGELGALAVTREGAWRAYAQRVRPVDTERLLLEVTTREIPL